MEAAITEQPGVIVLDCFAAPCGVLSWKKGFLFINFSPIDILKVDYYMAGVPKDTDYFRHYASHKDKMTYLYICTTSIYMKTP